MKATIIIPVKSLSIAKSRLAAHISPQQRKTLVLSMLSHVIKTVISSTEETPVYVISKDENVLALARQLHVYPLYEKTQTIGQNQALSYAARQNKKNSSPILALSADLPLLTPSDIRQLFSLIRTTDIVLAPSKEHTGTNAVFMQKPLLIPYLFGKNSLSKFQTAAQKQSYRIKMYSSPTFMFDLDTIDDLLQLKTHTPVLPYI